MYVMATVCRVFITTRNLTLRLNFLAQTVVLMKRFYVKSLHHSFVCCRVAGHDRLVMNCHSVLCAIISRLMMRYLVS